MLERPALVVVPKGLLGTWTKARGCSESKLNPPLFLLGLFGSDSSFPTLLPALFVPLLRVEHRCAVQDAGVSTLSVSYCSLTAPSPRLVDCIG